MKIILLKIKLLLLISFSVSNYSVANSFIEKKWTIGSKEKEVRYLQNVYENITIQKDVVFRETINSKGTKQKLGLDIYFPENDSIKDRRVIVWIHGGGFTFGNDKTQFYIVEMAKRFTRKGYVCLSVDYRVRENPMDDITGTISDAVEDVLKGLEWLRENSESLNVDASKIIIGGGSAGGILGCNLCFNDRADKNDKAGIIGFVDMWGTPDEKWSKLDINRNDPPTIIVHGTEDQLVSYSNSVELAERLKANNIKHELITIEGAGHTPIRHMDEFETKIAVFLYDIIN